MPVPSLITDLSQTAGSNYPSGGDSPSTLDDTMRATSAFIAQLRDGKGASAPVSLASAATVDIGAQNSQFVEITGTTGITSFGTTYNGPRYLRFQGAVLLTHNATTLNLPGAANITTAAGDVLIAEPNLALNGWNVVSYQRAALTPDSVTSAVNLTGTTQWSTPYQSASGATSFVSAGTTGYFYVSNSAGAPSWSNALPTSATINSNAVGYKEVPLLNQTPATAITTADSGKSFYASASGTWTIPANASQAFPVGSVLTFINMNATSCTIAITTDTMYLAGTGTTGSRTLAQYGMATAIKMTSTTWLISGSGLT